MTEIGKSQKSRGIPVQILYLLLFAVVFIPILYPIGLPLVITEPTKSLVEVIKAVPDGGKVFISTDYSAAGVVEVSPQLIPIIRNLISRKVSIVFASFITPDGALWPPIIFAQLSVDLKTNNYEYGTNYAFLGFYPGGDVSVAAFSANIRSIAKKDYYGRSIEELPVMKNINKITDFDLSVVSGSGGLSQMIQQMQAPYHMPMVMCTMAVDYSTMVRFYASRDLIGLTSGLRGAAEIEKAFNMPGSGLSSMDVMSSSHLLVIVLIVFGNIGFVLSKWRKK
jgi:hypothetical protein